MSCVTSAAGEPVRYPGDPQGQAWVGGARQYMAIKRVGGLDVACFWKEEWQEMRFFHGWIGWELPIKSGYISYIWLLKSDYIIVGECSWQISSGDRFETI